MSFNSRLYHPSIAHIVPWVVYGLVQLTVLQLSDLSLWHVLPATAYQLVFDIAVFYSLYAVIYPRYLAGERWKLVACLFLALILYPPLKAWIDLFLGVYSPVRVTVSDSSISSDTVAFVVECFMRLLKLLFLMFMAFVVRLTVDRLQNSTRQQELEKQNLINELAFLRSQVNPHFLFNTLNSLYALSEKKAETASVAILKLSDLMRYMLYESDEERVPLHKEVDYLENFIALQSLRLVHNDTIVFHKPGTLSGIKIAPLLLIPLVENAFKHGSLKAPHSVVITLQCTPEEVHFSVVNRQKHPPRPEGGGVGLSNLQKRLAVIYPNRHFFQVTEEKGEFKAELRIMRTK